MEKQSEEISTQPMRSSFTPPPLNVSKNSERAAVKVKPEDKPSEALALLTEDLLKQCNTVHQKLYEMEVQLTEIKGRNVHQEKNANAKWKKSYSIEDRCEGK